jgi:hypothetical protein
MAHPLHTYIHTYMSLPTGQNFKYIYIYIYIYIYLKFWRERASIFIPYCISRTQLFSTPNCKVGIEHDPESISSFSHSQDLFLSKD